jgi:hypothetical protein
VALLTARLIMPCAILFEQQALVRWLRHLQDVIVAIKLYAFVVPL